MQSESESGKPKRVLNNNKMQSWMQILTSCFVSSSVDWKSMLWVVPSQINVSNLKKHACRAEVDNFQLAKKPADCLFGFYTDSEYKRIIYFKKSLLKHI